MAPEVKPDERLPFEPKRNKTAKAKVRPAQTPLVHQRSSAQAPVGIPQVVSQRMARRMAVFCGVPTLLGMMTFIGSYWVVSHDVFELPPVVTLISSLGFFGLGILGLSYGVLSASWDEERVGNAWGWQEFTANWGRMTEAWRTAKQRDPDS